MNYDYIVNVLCENKDRPELQCDGKCYLSKLLAEESGENQKNPFSERQSKSEIQHLVFFKSIVDHPFLYQNLLQRADNFKTTVKLVQRLFSADIAHPPEFI